MGREEIEALIAILRGQQESTAGNLALGTWTIRFDKKRGAFSFDKCEAEGYCEERPAVIAMGGEVLDPGGPLFG
jgi:hypothetical protein